MANVPQVKQLAVVGFDGRHVRHVAVRLQRRVAIGLLNAGHEKAVRLHLGVFFVDRGLRVDAVRLATTGQQHVRHPRSQIRQLGVGMGGDADHPEIGRHQPDRCGGQDHPQRGRCPAGEANQEPGHQ